MKKVLITGGTKGLGYSLVQKYLNNGYEVYTTYCHNLVNKIPNVNYLKMDLDNDKSIDELIDSIPKIDILINNAGMCEDDDIKYKEYESFRKVISINLIGPLYLTKKIATANSN